jgi:hypothetical protein
MRVEDAVAAYRGVPVSILDDARQMVDLDSFDPTASLVNPINPENFATEAFSVNAIEPAAGDDSMVDEGIGTESDRAGIVKRGPYSIVNLDEAYHVE